MADSDVLACCVSVWQLHSWVRTIEGRMVVVGVDLAQAHVSANDRSQP